MPNVLGNLSDTQILDGIADYLRTQAKGDPVYLAAIEKALANFRARVETQELHLMLGLKTYPVSMEEFMFGDEYLARPRKEIYPNILEELIKINNPEGCRIVNPYTEGVFTGGIGSGKTTVALYTIAYQLYVLSCFRHPHDTFGMDSTSEILFVFQSMSGSLAQIVDYQRFREICEQSFYFRHVFPFDPKKSKELIFPGRIEVRAVGSDGGAIGQNVIGGLIDELNFMAIVHGSKKSLDKGVYNQAMTIYTGIARRRKSRFLSAGAMPGILCLVSSKRYPEEFTDMKLEEAKTDPTIYTYDKRVWDIKPEGTFSRGFFKVFVGDLTRRARLLTDDEKIPPEDEDLVVEVPEDYREDFQNDMIGALRDIAGVGTLARYPFILNVTKLNACFGTVESIFTLPETDFVTTKLAVDTSRFQDLQFPRWAHIDLGVTNDAAGLAVGHCPGFKTLTRGQGEEQEKEVLPIVTIDGILRVTPPKNDEILFYKIRDILYLLRNHGMNIRWVTFDSYQSVDSIQLLRQKGFVAGLQSIDKTNNPYELTKAAFYDGRILLPEHDICKKEFLSLEKDNKTGKLDHPPNGSKDCSDSVAGVTSGLSMRREIWGMFNIPVQVYVANVQKVEAKKSVNFSEEEESEDPNAGLYGSSVI